MPYSFFSSFIFNNKTWASSTSFEAARMFCKVLISLVSFHSNRATGCEHTQLSFCIQASENVFGGDICKKKNTKKKPIISL